MSDFNDILAKALSEQKKHESDLVEVVRCKDCKWWHDYSPPLEATWCARGAELRPQESGWVRRNADDFCSRGERKDEVEG